MGFTKNEKVSILFVICMFVNMTVYYVLLDRDMIGKDLYYILVIITPFVYIGTLLLLRNRLNLSS